MKTNQQKKKRRSHSLEGSPRGTPRNSLVKLMQAPPDSPRNRVPYCRTCNFRGEKPKGNFLKNALKRTLIALRASDTLNKPFLTSRCSDSMPEYDGTYHSIDMLPVVRFSPEFDRELAKNTRSNVSVFVMSRPWWTIRLADELPPYQPISKMALDMCYARNPAVFERSPGRKKFYDPLVEDLETLKQLDVVHNSENRVISNTFFSGIFVQAAKTTALKKRMSREFDVELRKEREKRRDTSPEISKLPDAQVQRAERTVRFAEEPYYLHQYNRKDRDIWDTPNYRRNFVHTEHSFHRGGGASKESLVPARPVKKGLVFD